MLFFFGALPIDQLIIEDKKYKKDERNPFKTFSRKPARKSEHVRLYTSETHRQFTGILPIYNMADMLSLTIELEKTKELEMTRFTNFGSWGGPSAGSSRKTP